MSWLIIPPRRSVPPTDPCATFFAADPNGVIVEHCHNNEPYFFTGEDVYGLVTCIPLRQLDRRIDVLADSFRYIRDLENVRSDDPL